jgi:hypothetical protein
MQLPRRPGDYLIFQYGGFTEAYPTNGAPMEVLRSWLPEDCYAWAVVWSPSRTQAKKAAILLKENT